MTCYILSNSSKTTMRWWGVITAFVLVVSLSNTRWSLIHWDISIKTQLWSTRYTWWAGNFDSSLWLDSSSSSLIGFCPTGLTEVLGSVGLASISPGTPADGPSCAPAFVVGSVGSMPTPTAISVLILADPAGSVTHLRTFHLQVISSGSLPSQALCPLKSHVLSPGCAL